MKREKIVLLTKLGQNHPQEERSTGGGGGDHSDNQNNNFDDKALTCLSISVHLWLMLTLWPFSPRVLRMMQCKTGMLQLLSWYTAELRQQPAATLTRRSAPLPPANRRDPPTVIVRKKRRSYPTPFPSQSGKTQNTLRRRKATKTTTSPRHLAVFFLYLMTPSRALNWRVFRFWVS